MSRWRVSVDSGGTFTDICLFDESEGRVEVWKVPSTPDDPSRGIAQGVDESLRRVASNPGAQPAASVSYFGHGTTVATNALIQHRGVRTGLVTTEGFRDLLEIGRQKRPDLYDFFVNKPLTLVPRDLRIEVPERVHHTGKVEKALDVDAVRKAARKLRSADVRAVAICFLYSFVRPEHEQEAKRILEEELSDSFICASHEIAPEFREFERLSTAVVNAYLGPVMRGYINRLVPRLAALGIAATPHMTQSNGGIIGFETAAAMPVRTVLSGPSTGVVGAQAVGKAAGFTDLITFDMGGTSTDVALLKDGQARLASEATVHGYPLKAPMLNIHTVGAGGGSIAYVDTGRLLKVGPRSAGADPGPVCYGHGNLEPTVTDANIVLQTLNPAHLLGGGMAVMQTAQGIVSVVTANIARAIRVISVQRGHDPRDYTLIAFGGAGPLHAARLARELDIRRILVPRSPGILCAMGLLLTDLRADFAATRLAPLARETLHHVETAFAALDRQAEAWFAQEHIDAEARRLIRTVDMRYAGQNYELSVSVPEGPVTAATVDLLAQGFADAHERMYGFVAEGEPVQLVTFRVEAIGLARKATLKAEPLASEDATNAIREHRHVWIAEEERSVPCPVYERDWLKAGNNFVGPAIVEQMDATTFILPAMIARVDVFSNLILEAA